MCGARRPSCARPMLLEHLRDAKIEQLYRATRRHQNVGLLEVPVDDLVAMRVVDSVGDRDKKLEPLSRAEATRLAVAVDGNAVDVLEH